MSAELIYILKDPKTRDTTLVVTQIESAEEWQKLKGKTIIASCLRVFNRPPPLDMLFPWQSFVVNTFNDVLWNANVKVEMLGDADYSRPDIKNLFGSGREFRLTLKGSWI